MVRAIKGNRFIVGDYGAGKYIDHIRAFVEKQGGYYFPYDTAHPEYDNWSDNSKLKALMEVGLVDILICSNLLNVIKEDDIVTGIHQSLFASRADYFITIHDGNLSGVGKTTKPDSWQRNETIESYLLYKGQEEIKKGVICRHESLIYLK